MSYKGVIIEESLENSGVLKEVEILDTKVEPITEKHQTPHLKQWTLHTVEVLESEAEKIAQELSRSLRGGTPHDSWYADFKSDSTHFIIFRNKVFKIDRSSKEQYDEATKYGLTLGIPDYQLDFSPHIQQWKR